MMDYWNIQIFKKYLKDSIVFLSFALVQFSLSENPPVQADEKKGISLPEQKLQFTKPSEEALSQEKGSQVQALPPAPGQESENPQQAPQNQVQTPPSAPSQDPLQLDVKLDSNSKTQEGGAGSLPQELAEDADSAEKADVLDSAPALPSNDPDADLKLQIKQRIKSYTYDPILRKDPFAKPGGLETTVDVSPEEAIHPVEEENIENLRLKAIIWSNDGVIPRALFETAKGNSYTLSKNDRIGNQGSIIYRVDTNRVWYMKPFIDPVTKQLGYKPNGISLEKEKKVSEELWYER